LHKRLTRAPRLAAAGDLDRATITLTVSTIPESASSANKVAHMRHMVDQLHKLEERLREGGGAAKIERQHRAGKMTATSMTAKRPA